MKSWKLFFADEMSRKNVADQKSEPAKISWECRGEYSATVNSSFSPHFMPFHLQWNNKKHNTELIKCRSLMTRHPTQTGCQLWFLEVNHGGVLSKIGVDFSPYFGWISLLLNIWANQQKVTKICWSFLLEAPSNITVFYHPNIVKLRMIDFTRDSVMNFCRLK